MSLMMKAKKPSHFLLPCVLGLVLGWAPGLALGAEVGEVVRSRRLKVPTRLGNPRTRRKYGTFGIVSHVTILWRPAGPQLSKSSLLVMHRPTRVLVAVSQIPSKTAITEAKLESVQVVVVNTSPVSIVLYHTNGTWPNGTHGTVVPMTVPPLGIMIMTMMVSWFIGSMLLRSSYSYSSSSM
jgi:hypothetical protein